MNFSNQVAAANSVSVPVSSTSFYQWLAAGGYTDDRLGAIVGYLGTFGFVPTQDTVSSTVLGALRIIYHAYFENEVLK